jgi:acyl-CoA reductase-like NAD-dependent aldehyde dehydrogenase
LSPHADILQRLNITLPPPARAAFGAADPLAQRLICAASEQAYADVPHATADDVDAAVARANRAFESGPWRRMTAGARSAILCRAADAILAHGDELAVLHTLETGIPIAQARSMHVPRSAENIRFFGEIINSLAGESYDQTGRFLSIVTREPIGTGLLIAPWNAPLVLASMKMGACLALGNSLIIKPSEYAPLSVLRMAALMHEAGVPADVLQVLTGPGAVIGQALVAHAGIDAVGFVGGTTTGKRIMATAAGTLKKVGLELGGKSANIILDSADFDRAVDGSLMGIFAGNGEQCLAGSRILVQAGIADRFIDAFTARVQNLRIGDPFDDATEIGPLAFAAHYDRVMSFAAEAHADSQYRVLTGGRRAPGFDSGHYFAPTVVETTDNAAPLCQQEIFGPFVMIQRVADLDEALACANASDFGLASYIWSDDLPSVMRARQELRAGTVWVNTPMARDLRAPFGGYKQSGIGRDGLPGSIELFSEEKTTMIPHMPLTLPRLGIKAD